MQHKILPPYSPHEAVKHAWKKGGDTQRKLKPRVDLHPGAIRLFVYKLYLGEFNAVLPGREQKVDLKKKKKKFFSLILCLNVPNTQDRR